MQQENMDKPQEIKKERIEYFNGQRVTKSMQQIVPLSQKEPDHINILCGNSMYASALMDGEIKVLSVAGSSGQDNLKMKVEDAHFIETSYGVTQSKFFQFPDAQGQLA